ncbi:MAG: HAD-IC family P-type ATPase, partial [Clostridia bacterium]|nr:HAD-IC family P-type ATPase [Clostridia bacterium]
MAFDFLKKKTKKEDEKKPRGKLELTGINTETGLTPEQVRERTLKGYANTPVVAPTKTVKQIILGNILTYFNLIFVILAVFLLVVGAIKDTTFMIIVVINTTVGIVQQINAKKTLDKLNIISEPRIRVIRGGQEFSVPSADLVQGDLVIFEHGSQICADARVCGGSVRVNESLVTGESDEIEKNSGDVLLSGSFIVSGQCSAILEKVGDESFVSHLTLEAKKERKKAKGMMYSLDNLVKIIGIVLIPIGVLLFLRQFLGLGMDLQSTVTKTTAALIGMIPEGLYLLADIALTISIIKLAKKKTLVHDMKCIETLARVDVLCVDKTGTITENRMTVKDFVTIEPSYCSEQAVKKLLGDFVGNMDAENATMQAMKEAFSVTTPRKAVETVAFSSVTKCSSASFADNTTFILGAPEFTLGERYQQYAKTIEGYAAGGNRVLVFCEVT